MTIEQLMKKVLQAVERMSPEEKAEVRQALTKAFPPGKSLEGAMTVCIVRDRVCCVNCKIPVESILNELCRCCEAMKAAVEAQPGLVTAQREYEEENSRRAENKRRIMEGNSR